MKLLKKAEYRKVTNYLDKYIHLYPIIISVVEGLQEGMIFENNTSFIIVHKFGFAYILNKKNGSNVYYKELVSELLNNVASSVVKIRMFDPNNYLENDNYFEKFLSKRIKWKLEKVLEDDIYNENFLQAEKINCDFPIFSELDLFDRFWNNCHDFVSFSNAVIWKQKEVFKGICYSAAISDSFTEVDVFVDSSFRNEGIGAELVQKYSLLVFKSKRAPLWDCYSNNIASCKLAEKTGFKYLFEYNFYNINTG